MTDAPQCYMAVNDIAHGAGLVSMTSVKGAAEPGMSRLHDIDALATVYFLTLIVAPLTLYLAAYARHRSTNRD